jgi:hypothetical protein
MAGAMDPKPPGRPPGPPPLPPRPQGAGARPAPPAGAKPPPLPAKRKDDTATHITTTKAKAEVVASALRLRDEQIRARVVYFGADQRTNSELDAITEQVVAELRALQSAQAVAQRPQDRATIEVELIAALRGLLEKLLSGRRETFVRKKIEQVQRRITSLYFNTFLGGQDEDRARVMQSHEQALFHALKRREAEIVADLDSMQYVDAGDRQVAIEQFRRQLRQLSLEFLARTQPELELVLKVYCEELAHFLFRDFGKALGDFAWQVIRESRAADGQAFGYKLSQDAFGRFREVFDAKFLEQLVGALQDPVVRRLDGQVSDATLEFVGGATLYNEVCTVIANSMYDYLHGEGFLDLPVQWKEHLAQS